MKTLATAMMLVLVLIASVGCESTRQVFGIPADNLESPNVHRPENIRWQPATMLPPGAEMAVLEGDPNESGYFVLRFRMPDGYRIPPHWHTTPERITVIRGNAYLGMGEQFDEAALQPLPTGTYAAMPASMRHYLLAEGQTEVQINTLGPWTITYVNPSDDPRAIRPQ